MNALIDFDLPLQHIKLLNNILKIQMWLFKNRSWKRRGSRDRRRTRAAKCSLEDTDYSRPYTKVLSVCSVQGRSKSTEHIICFIEKHIEKKKREKVHWEKKIKHRNLFIFLFFLFEKNSFVEDVNTLQWSYRAELSASLRNFKELTYLIFTSWINIHLLNTTQFI